MVAVALKILTMAGLKQQKILISLVFRVFSLKVVWTRDKGNMEQVVKSFCKSPETVRTCFKVVAIGIGIDSH